jgi:hypothetical protein
MSPAPPRHVTKARKLIGQIAAEFARDGKAWQTNSLSISDRPIDLAVTTKKGQHYT